MFPSIPRRHFLLGTAAAICAAACEPARVEPLTPALPPSGPSKRIIIVGGGISGLAIALDLLAKGFDPLVLEASERPGGRIHTIRSPFPDGLYVEAGATFVIADPNLLKLLGDLNIPLAPPRPSPKNLSKVFLKGDKRLVIPPGGEPPEEYTLSDEEKTLEEKPFGAMRKYFGLLQGIDPTQPFPPAFGQYDSLSGAEFLKKQGASQGYMESVRGSFAPDEPLERVSALSLMREVSNFMREIELKGEGGRILGGSDRLPSAMAQKLGERVIYGAQVKRMEQGPGGVRLSFIRKGELNHIEGTRAVSTLPSTVLRDIEIAPTLSAEKEKALRELSMVSVSRLWIGSKQRFWLSQGEHGRVESDAPLGPVRDETSLLDGTGGILGLYVTGAEARKLASMSEDERHKVALKYALRAHPGLEGQITAQVSKCWDNDPLAKGAYARFSPGQMTGLLPALSKVEGRLHFAGDQMSFRPGFMHGALASARRVVGEIVGAKSG